MGLLGLPLQAVRRTRHLRSHVARALKRVRRQAELLRNVLRRVAKAVARAPARAARAVRRRLRGGTRAVRTAAGRGGRTVRRVWHVVPGEATACPACGAGRLRLLDTLPLLRDLHGCRVGFVTGCGACGLVFTNPPYSEEELAALYTTEGVWASSREQMAEPGDPSPEKMLSLFGAMRPEVDVLAPPPGAAVLDIGCGNGRILNGLQRLGWHTCGIEPAVKVAFRRHVELTSVPDEPGFRLLLLRHVLEHLRDPMSMLRRAERALVPGGHLFISVPNLDALPAHRDYRYCISDRPHVSAFTSACLASLLGRAGLRVVAHPSNHSSGRASARMVVLARKEAKRPALPACPLDAASAAIRGYYLAAGSAPPMLPVRVRAGLANARRVSASIERARARRRTP